VFQFRQDQNLTWFLHRFTH